MRDHHLDPRAAERLDAAIDSLRDATINLRAALTAQREVTSSDPRAATALASLAYQVERAAGAAVAVREAYNDESSR